MIQDLPLHWDHVKSVLYSPKNQNILSAADQGIVKVCMCVCVCMHGIVSVFTCASDMYIKTLHVQVVAAAGLCWLHVLFSGCKECVVTQGMCGHMCAISTDY